MIILRTRQFSKKVPKLSARIKSALAERLRIFMNEPFHPLLHNHALHGDREPYWSINITGDYRLIYEKLDNTTVRLIDVDTHHNLYGN